MDTRISGGSKKGRRLRSSKRSGLRPTSEKVRSAIFSLIGNEGVEGARVLDLYAGTGALGIEALSRGAALVDFVERDASRCRDLRENVAGFGFGEKSRIIRGKVERTLTRLDGRYAIVLADPSYKDNPWETLMGRLQERNLLEDYAKVVAEHSHIQEISDHYAELEIWKRRRYGDTVVSIFINGA